MSGTRTVHHRRSAAVSRSIFEVALHSHPRGARFAQDSPKENLDSTGFKASCTITDVHSMSDKSDLKVPDAHSQEVPPEEVQHTKAGARGVRAGGNAGAMGDPVSDQSRHNYQVSRDTDMSQHAQDAASSRIKVQGSQLPEP